MNSFGNRVMQNQARHTVPLDFTQPLGEVGSGKSLKCGLQLMYEGRYVTGKVEKVFLLGELIVDGDHWLGRKGGGKYQKRSASGVF